MKVWAFKGKKDNVSWFNFACLDNDCGKVTVRLTILRMCNDSNVTIQERNAYDFDLNSPWLTTPWSNVAVEQSVG